MYRDGKRINTSLGSNNLEPPGAQDFGTRGARSLRWRHVVRAKHAVDMILDRAVHGIYDGSVL